MEVNTLVTLKLIGFNEEERNNFAAVLTLAGRALKKTWQVVDREEADFFLLSAQSSATANRDRLLTGLFADRCLFCSTENATSENELQVDNNHVPRLSALVALFNKACERQEAAVKPKATESVSQTSSPFRSETAIADSFFDPHKGLLGHLLSAKHEQFIVSLNGENQSTPLYIDTEKNAYYSKNTQQQLDNYLANPQTLNIKAISKAEIENIVTTESLKPAPLKELIWYTVIKTSSGKLIKDHSAATDIVALKSWPDLRLFKCIDYAKVATFMKNNAAPLEIIAEQTEMPLAEVNNFYNACYLMGLIEPRNQVEINKKNISSERLDLLNKIDARLK